MQPNIRDIPPLRGPAQVAYLDTVRSIYPPTDDEALEQMRQSWRAYCRHGWIENFHVRRTKNNMIEVSLHRPARAILDKVARDITAKRCALFGVDIALDFIADAQHPIATIRASAERHQLQMNIRDNVRVKFYRDDPTSTRYMKGRLAGRNSVTYSDRPSKVTGQPCVHVEARVRGATALRRLNITPDNFPSLTTRDEQVRIFNRVVRFVTFDLENIGRAIIARHGKGWANAGDFTKARRVAGLHARRAMYELHDVGITATVMSVMCRKLGLRSDRLMSAVDVLAIHPTTPAIC